MINLFQSLNFNKLTELTGIKVNYLGSSGFFSPEILKLIGYRTDRTDKTIKRLQLSVLSVNTFKDFKILNLHKLKKMLGQFILLSVLSVSCHKVFQIFPEQTTSGSYKKNLIAIMAVPRVSFIQKWRIG